MEQLSPQHVRSSLSGGQADSERTQFNTRVRKHTIKASTIQSSGKNIVPLSKRRGVVMEFHVGNVNTNTL